MGYLPPSKCVDTAFPQCNVYTGVLGGCSALTPLDGYLNIFIR